MADATLVWPAPKVATQTSGGLSGATVEIILPVHNALDDVRACLDSVRRAHSTRLGRVLLVDDCSDPETADWLVSQQDEQVRYLRTPANLGFTRAVALGFEHSTAALVVVLNSDTVVGEGWLAALAHPFDHRGDVAMTGPLSNAAAWQSLGRITNAQGLFATNALPAGADVAAVNQFLRAEAEHGFVDLPLVHGFCFMIVRSAYDAVGGFDLEGFGRGYGETQDLCFRLTAAGYRIGVCTDVFVQHGRSRSYSDQQRSSLSVAARDTLYRKHGALEYLQAEAFCIDNRELTELRAAAAGWFAEQSLDIVLFASDAPRPDEFTAIAIRSHERRRGRRGGRSLLALPRCGGTEIVGLPWREPVAPASAPAGQAARILAEQAASTRRGVHFEEFRPADSGNVPPRAKVLAYYLPQYHPIAENDRFWGKGFTEWRNVARGMPRFAGHVQPRLPRDLGFYDLAKGDVMRRQIEMAKAAGLFGFCFYHYWFDGRRVLETPVDRFLADPSLDFPFCIMWANENWTRTWDGADREILLQQNYRDDDDEALVDDLARHFRDGRYIRLDGRPLCFIYRPGHVPDCRSRVARWRQIFAERHGEMPLIFMARAFGDKDPTAFGLDGAIEFPPHGIFATAQEVTAELDILDDNHEGVVYDYEDVTEAATHNERGDMPLIRTVFPSWDNEARRPGRGTTVTGSTPEKFRRWLEWAVQEAMAHPVAGEPLVCVNAWNEWAEGAYLEPDVHFGAAYLNTMSRVIHGPVADLRITAVLPCFNHAAYLPYRLASVLNQSHPPDEIIFLDDGSNDDSLKIATEVLQAGAIPYRIIASEKNSGSVFGQWLKGIDAASHDLIWIAETDDFADPGFLANLLPAFLRDDVMLACGRIAAIGPSGEDREDLETYWQGLDHLSRDRSATIPAARLFERDFVSRNLIANVSGAVFRKPLLTQAERDRLTGYRFAGDWYFYALVLRGGQFAYRRLARAQFRMHDSSRSRSSLFGDLHLSEHARVLADIAAEYGLSHNAIDAHCQRLSQIFPSERLARFRSEVAPLVSVKNRPLRICIGADSFSPGGGEKLPLHLANALRARGHHVTYLVVDDLLPAGAPSIRADLHKDIPVVNWRQIQADPTGFFRAFRFDVLNSHNVSLDLRLANGGYDPDLPYVVSLHGGYEAVADQIQPHGAYLRRNVARWLYLDEKNLAPLESLGLEDTKIGQTFNALPEHNSPRRDRVTIRRELGLPHEAFALVIASRAIFEKGWEIAIEAVRKARGESARDIVIVLIGTGPEADRLAPMIQAEPWVYHLGYIENPGHILHAFDLGVLPSTFAGESFPLFLLECFDAGLPVLATDIGAIPRMIAAGGGGDGQLISCKLEPAEMARALCDRLVALLSDDERLDAARSCAVSAAQAFTMDHLVRAYETIFREACAGVSPGSAPKLEK